MATDENKAQEAIPPKLLKQWEGTVTLSHAHSSHLAQLDVRGTRFVTSRATLLAAETSYFCFMLQSTTHGGPYFLDVDPTHFHRVLCFLHHGRFSFDGLNAWECRELRATAKFLHLAIPDLTPWAWAPPLSGKGLSLTEGNSVLTFAGRGIVVGDGLVYSFRVRISDRIRRDIYIGFTPATVNGRLPSGPDCPMEPNRRGFYVYLPNWTLFGPGDAFGRPQQVPHSYIHSNSNFCLYMFDLSVALDDDNTMCF
ncbi:Aste57867_17477 [Aphanomyces stellatus]|uniref:Aste57867_17477 protein n=1 Tax=Aphanomyces stellatus TaxID=120398 RepID=A0A485L7Z9_9STRA|nr:hypothetical protein As57867_017417 [Aphanomyces stellatus]VFT94230.1 Aste57867_17477 [Aphanomyces stellatus]